MKKQNDIGKLGVCRDAVRIIFRGMSFSVLGSAVGEALRECVWLIIKKKKLKECANMVNFDRSSRKR